VARGHQTAGQTISHGDNGENPGQSGRDFMVVFRSAKERERGRGIRTLPWAASSNAAFFRGAKDDHHADAAIKREAAGIGSRLLALVL
jgi:hypothetical protein